jgi:hypothetical protein
MERSWMRGRVAAALAAACMLGTACATKPGAAVATNPLTGTWILVAADVIKPDGERLHDFGAAPTGLLVVDAEGRYSLQIFKSERPRFASADKDDATPTEYRSAVMGSSTHFGRVSVDAASGTLAFSIASASFPNWEGTTQTRHFDLKDGVLSYQVPPRPNGDVPLSVWRRAG